MPKEIYNESYKQAIVGNVTIGGDEPIAVQTMTNTDTLDIEATVAQCRQLAMVGADMIRITVPTMREVVAFVAIKERLRAEGIFVPLIADVHFSSQVAVAVAAVADKVRINPGNFSDKRSGGDSPLSEEEYQHSLDQMAKRASPLIEVCKKHGTALRVGVNQGSLSGRIVSRYGNTPLAMAMSAIEWLDICQRFDFHNVLFSIKSSNLFTMIDATRLLNQKMEERGTIYPLHLGVTEAGNDLEARAKSSAGIGALLMLGIGNTVRVSLTEPPENEVVFAKKMLNIIGGLSAVESRLSESGLLQIDSFEEDLESMLIEGAALCGYYLQNKSVTDLKIENSNFSKEEIEHVEHIILQACRIKFTHTEFIACPSCGRTQYDIMQMLALVKSHFANYPSLKIAVMGCIVNGPGEMADADYGFIGAGNGLVVLFQGTQKISSPMTIEEAVGTLTGLLGKNAERRTQNAECRMQNAE
ncbi:MAG: (E)-4-hydroxy-3-methylbut-2-enyl-diphosphate synthase [Bacteroidales bacterium]|jgi:(E)-4-hydroxy-3-methylbut-2-enyl-diphosphate synthase|nr:(E)-4-hydroxy-3-methylbut-2-enyl-diphosphate synthase [Bacteroidales bacterium]